MPRGACGISRPTEAELEGHAQANARTLPSGPPRSSAPLAAAAQNAAHGNPCWARLRISLQPATNSFLEPSLPPAARPVGTTLRTVIGVAGHGHVAVDRAAVTVHAATQYLMANSDVEMSRRSERAVACAPPWRTRMTTVSAGRLGRPRCSRRHAMASRLMSAKKV